MAGGTLQSVIVDQTSCGFDIFTNESAKRLAGAAGQPAWQHPISNPIFFALTLLRARWRWRPAAEQERTHLGNRSSSHTPDYVAGKTRRNTAHTLLAQPLCGPASLLLGHQEQRPPDPL